VLTGNAPPILQGLRGQLARFLVVGLTATGIDFALYRGLLALGAAIHPAKGLGFVTGALFAYFANRAITFQLGSGWRPDEVLRFVKVYAGALAGNVAVNFLVLDLIGRSEAGIVVAFVVATGVSAALNFVGMKWFVFNDRAGFSDHVAPPVAPALAPCAAVDGIRLSLVIPCYNEVRNLPLLVQRLQATFLSDDAEVILVDNGSTDGSAAVLNQLLAGQTRIRSVRVEHNRGYGFGILSGLRAARGRILGWTHADMQTDPADALRGLALFDEASSDAATAASTGAADAATLFVKGRRRGRPAADVAFTVGMSLFETVLMGRRMWDINAQPTLFPREFFERWQQPPHDFALDLYAYYESTRHGLRVRRIPVHFGERAHGSSHWNVNWRAKLRFIKRTVDFSLRLRQGRTDPA
jgi:putative flippase GtrA